jgi:hypothetical protein
MVIATLVWLTSARSVGMTINHTLAPIGKARQGKAGPLTAVEFYCRTPPPARPARQKNFVTPMNATVPMPIQ